MYSNTGSEWNFYEQWLTATSPKQKVIVKLNLFNKMNKLTGSAIMSIRGKNTVPQKISRTKELAVL